MNDWTADDGAVVQEFTLGEFAARLGLPPGSEVTATAVAWETLATSSEVVRVCFRPGPLAAVPAPRDPLEPRLRDLAAKWHAQSRHPQRRFQPEVRAMLARHAGELLGELDLTQQQEDTP